MSNFPLRCGILGTGTFAATHAEAIRSKPGLSLAVVSDTDTKRCEKFSEKWSATACSDTATLLETPLDIIALCTPDDTHGTLAMEILRHPHAPRLLIVEKPLCTSTEELEKLAQLPPNGRTELVVNFSRRFNAGFVRLRELIERGELGSQLLSAHWRYYAGWFRNGVHIVDLLRLLFGECTCENAVEKGVDRFPHDPLLDVRLRSARFPDAGIFLEGIPEHPYQMFEGEMLFSKGRIRIYWDDIFIDRLGEGYAGAPSLECAEHFRADPPLTAVQSLYASAEAFLLRGERDILDSAGLTTARGTMDILFSSRAASRT